MLSDVHDEPCYSFSREARPGASVCGASVSVMTIYDLTLSPPLCAHTHKGGTDAFAPPRCNPNRGSDRPRAAVAGLDPSAGGGTRARTSVGRHPGRLHNRIDVRSPR